MAITKDDFIRANNGDMRELFQEAIQSVMNLDIDEFANILTELDQEQRYLVSICVGKDRNALVHRFSSGAVPNSEDYMDVLVQAGCQECFSMPNGDRNLPLAIAISSNVAEVIPTIIANMKDTHVYLNGEGDTAFTLAINSNQMDLLPILMDNNMDPFMKSKSGKTPDMLIFEKHGEEEMRTWVAMTACVLATAAPEVVLVDDTSTSKSEALRRRSL
ncbi:hypothetical protein ACKF11_13380 [Methylobacillus sp. Pita2]|uniref:hypothetical protein n=1 Tax=Methylobacillus sp. Pita2 TaxID=3383245 RepID=UPI0038B558F4